MSLDYSFIIVDPCTNKFFAACEAYLVDTRKLSDEEYDALIEYPSPKTQELLKKHGMTLDSCEYHKIMEDAEEVEETMQIDLEEFVDKKVIVNLRSGQVIETVINVNKNTIYPYSIGSGRTYKGYTRYGDYNICGSGPLDIVKIELKEPQQPQKAMTPLSNATIQKLADALTDDAIKYLETDEEVIETLVSVIGRFLTDRMGQMDDTLLNGLSFIIFDNFDITSNIK